MAVLGHVCRCAHSSGGPGGFASPPAAGGISFFARLLASLLLFLGLCAVAADPAPPPISATIADDCDGLVPLGGPVTFELEGLAYTAGQTTGEWPDPGEDAWSVEWSHNHVDWFTTAERIAWTPAASLLGATGRFEVWARVSVSVPVGENQEEEIGPVEFTHFVYLVGVQAVECSLDAGATWTAPAAVLAIPERTTVLFRAQPAGAGLFPAGEPVWDAAAPGLVPGVAPGTMELFFPEPATSVEAPCAVAASCGTSIRSGQVLPVGVARILSRTRPQAEYAAITGVATVPVGATVYLRAESRPAGAPWPAGQPRWTGAQAVAGEAAEATASFSAPAASAIDLETVTASCGGAADAGLLPCAIAGFQYRIGAAGEFQDLPEDILYVPLNVAVFLRAVIVPVGAAWPVAEPQWSANADPSWQQPGVAVYVASTLLALAGEPEVVQATWGDSSAEARIAALDGLTLFARRTYLGVGDSITLEAKRIVAGVLAPVDCDWTLLAGAADAAFEGVTTNTASVTLTGLSVSTQYTGIVVRATDSALPTEFDTAGFTVTRIRLYATIDGGEPAEVTGTLYVPRGSAVTFEADLLPHFSPWPDDGPEWTGAVPGVTVGTASAEFAEVSPSVADPELVTVTCGGSAAAAVVVYDLGPIRYRFSQFEPWTEAPEALAIPQTCELVHMRASLLPPDIPPADLCIGWAGAQASVADPCEATLTPAPGPLVSVEDWPVVAATAGLLSRSIRAGRVAFGGIQYRICALNPDGTAGAAGLWQDSTPVPARVPVGCTVEFQAVAAGSQRLPLPAEYLSWASSTGKTGNGQPFSDTFRTVSASNSDLRTVLVAYRGVSPAAGAAAEFVACGIGGLQWAPGTSGGTWVAVDRVLCVAVGEPFRLKALATPAGPWPDGMPQWWMSGPSTVGGSTSEPVVTDASQADQRTLHYTTASSPAWNPIAWARTTAACGTSAASAHIAVVSGFTLLPSWPSVHPGGSVSIRQYEDTGMDQDADLVTVSRHWRLDQGGDKGSLSPASGQSATFTGSAASDRVNDVHVVASDAADGPAVASASLTVVDGDVLWYAAEGDPLWTDSATRLTPTPPPVAVARGAALDFLFGPQPDSSAQPDAVFVWPWGKPAWTVTGAECLTPASTPEGPASVEVAFNTAGTATVAAECGNTLTFTAGVLDIGPFTLTAAGLTTGSAEDASPAQESREEGAVLYTGPSDDGVIVFTLECELHDLFLHPPPPGVLPPTGADVGWRIQDPAGNLLTPGQFSAVEGDFAAGPATVTWTLGAADGIVQEVDFVAYYKGVGVIGGGIAGMRRLIHCTIVKPDLILHRPVVQEAGGPAVDGWTDADNDGVRAASEEEETDPGLFMAVNDDFDSGGPDPDCEDADVTGLAAEVAADLEDMAQVEISLPGGEVLPGNACLQLTAAPPAPVRLFRVVETDSDGDGAVDVTQYQPVVGADAASTWTIPLADLAGNAAFYLEGAEPGESTLTLGFIPPSPPPPPPTEPPNYFICQTAGGGGSAVVGRDPARVRLITVDLDVDLNRDGTFTEDDPQEVTSPGLLLSVNEDDDGVPAGPDNSNTLIDTATDRADMAVLKLRQLQPAVLTSGTLTLSVSDKSKLRLFDQYDTARIGPFPGPDTDSYQVPLGDITGGDLDFLTEGVSLGEVTVSLVYRDTSGNVASRDDIKVTVVRVDLDIANGGSDLDNGEESGASPCTPLAEDQEGDPTGPGSYLLVNWDDDNGDPANLGADPIPDMSEGNDYVGYHAVLGEDNLAKLFPSLDMGGGIIPSTGIVALECPHENTRVRFFTEAVKGTRLQFSASSGTRKHYWNLQDSAQRGEFSSAVANGIWMEGVDASSAERDIEVTLAYGLGGGDIGSDTVKATVALIRLGDAVYRENMLGWTVYPLRERCHAGLVYAFDGPCSLDDLRNPTKYGIVQMKGLNPASEKLDDILQDGQGFEYWYCYTNTAEIKDDVAGYVKRLKILKVAYWAWHDWNSHYCPFDCMVPKGSDWDGTLADVYALRCDGLVELAYEFNGIMVWGKIVGGAAHYDMRNNAYLAEHNDWQWGDDPEEWDWDMYGSFLPVTQGGFADQYVSEHDPSYSGPPFRGNLWQTTFQEQRLVEPSVVSPEQHSHY